MTDIPSVDIRLRGAILPPPIRLNGLVSNYTWTPFLSHWPQGLRIAVCKGLMRLCALLYLKVEADLATETY